MESKGNCNSFWQVAQTSIALQQYKESIRQRKLHEASQSLPVFLTVSTLTGLQEKTQWNHVKDVATDGDPDKRGGCGLF